MSSAQDDIPEHIQEHMTAYVNYDKDIEEAMVEVKRLRKLQKVCKQAIIQYMEEAERESLDCGEGREVKRKETQKVIYSEDRFYDHFDDPSQIEAYKTRNLTTRTSFSFSKKRRLDHDITG